MTKLNVFIKLQQARNELRKMDLKKTGKNTFSKYTYYELGDFLPAITDLCEKYKLCSIISFDSEIATLSIIDAENTDSPALFTSPIAEANLKGCHDVQNLGAVQTYLRRYLYMNAFEIVEHDWVDQEAEEKPESKPVPNKKEEEARDLKKDCQKKIIELYGKENYSKKLEELTEYEWQGKKQKGLNSLEKASEKRVRVLWGKIKDMKKEEAANE